MARNDNYFTRYALILTGLVLLFLTFFSSDSLINWVKAGFEIRRQENRIEKYKEEIGEMDRRIDCLTNNRDSLEKFAREEFTLAAPGDDVYLEEE